jgi:high-affinity iron transporter
MIGSQLGNVVFVIWRESVEALLIIGILNTWLRHNDIGGRGRIFLWSGVAAGLLSAVAFGTAIALFSESIPENTQQTYQAIAVLVAAGLIVQMVVWMRRHGRTLRGDIETALEDASAKANWWGVFALAAIAVAREGAETVVFLFGTLAAMKATSLPGTAAAVAAGFALALATYYILQLGSRILTWRVFFRFTEIMLLLLAASLVVSGVDILGDLGILPESHRVRDSSAILPDSGAFGGLVGALTGYRARPDAIEILTYGLYWGAIFWVLRKTRLA